MVLAIANTACEKPDPMRMPPASVIPENKPPVVSAGDDIIIEIPGNAADLTGSAYDPDGSIRQYDWKKISGPDCYFIDWNSLFAPMVMYMEEGVYEFEFSATDKDGLNSKDMRKITVASSLRKHIVASLLQDSSQITVVEVPGDVINQVKWVFVKYRGRCEKADNGPSPGIDYFRGGYYYEILPGNRIKISSQCEQVILYY
jgi:hypothetical protein